MTTRIYHQAGRIIGVFPEPAERYPAGDFVPVETVPENVYEDYEVVGGALALKGDANANERRRYELAVNAERQRRIAEGADFTPAGYTMPVALTGTEVDKINLTNLKLVADARLAANPATAVTTPFRDARDLIHDLTQPQVQDLWLQGTAWVSAIYQKAWDIKAMDPMAADVTDPALWTLP